MRISMKFILAAAAMCLAAVTGQALAQNQVIESAKEQCQIGEQLNGYLGPVSGSSLSADESREMRSVNQQRKTAYADIAESRGITVEQVGQIAGARLISEADSGECVQDQSGNWVKKQ